MSDLARQFGKRIYLFRKENGLTQAALAEKAKISNEFMSGVERGAKLPSLLTLERLAAALKINIKDLFDFNRAGFQQLQPFSREALDVASRIERVSGPQRRRISKIIKILVESDAE
jgi:transcriptional regulator with XRE-family HTH domain